MTVSSKVGNEPNSVPASQGGKGVTVCIEELTNAYQALAKKNADSVASSLQSLLAVRNPIEFFTLQQNLMKDSMAAAIEDSQRLSALTTAVLSAALTPWARQ